MKTRFAVAIFATLLTVAALAPSAPAATSKLYVTPYMGVVNFCRASTDQVRWSYTFKAKIKRKNSPLPKKVMIKYNVTDSSTGQVMVSQRLTLKPKKFYKIGLETQYTAGQQLSVTLDASFKSPLTGRTLRSHSVLPDSAPTVEMMDGAATAPPACAAG
ncbi:MAG: hypothetical protein HY827_09835 [Actinobacteria bacterium]|nr:hypothetical protein [Actinomycetota bacterium]